MKNKIAIFDIDHTIISVDSLFLFVFTIFKEYPLKLLYLPMLILSVILKLFGLISIERLKNIWLILLKNFDSKKLDNLCKNYIQNKIIKKIKPEAIELISNLKNEGYIIIFATASFEFYTKYIKDYLNADYLVGTKVVFSNNKYSIIGQNCKGKEKINRIKEIIDIKKTNLYNSLSYSDSKTDLPFLQITRKFHLIKKKKWEIIKIYSI